MTDPSCEQSGWREVNQDPVSPNVALHLYRRLEGLYAGPCWDYRSYLISAVENRTVLDIGVVEHALNYTLSADWLHSVIARHAKRTVGVDILVNEVAALNDRGYDIKLVNATSDTDLGERFDCVVAGDVIEHVDSPVQLLRFARRHLGAHGRLIVKTPNPHWWRYLVRVARGPFVANAEHVCWISPSMALELGYRAGLPLAEYRTVSNHGSSYTRRLGLSASRRIGVSEELLGAAYVYVYSPR